MNQTHLLLPHEISAYSRPISKHIDQDVLFAYIDETERTDIIPAIGGALFKSIINHIVDKSDNALLDFLLEGGMYPKAYNSTFDGTTEGDTYLAGLKKCASYYTLAKIIKGNDGQVTRFGYVEKNSEYSQRPYESEKNAAYREVASIADKYLAEVLAYLRTYAPLYEDYQNYKCINKGAVVNNRTRYKVIGD